MRTMRLKGPEIYTELANYCGASISLACNEGLASVQHKRWKRLRSDGACMCISRTTLHPLPRVMRLNNSDAARKPAVFQPSNRVIYYLGPVSHSLQHTITTRSDPAAITYIILIGLSNAHWSGTSAWRFMHMRSKRLLMLSDFRAPASLQRQEFYKHVLDLLVLRSYGFIFVDC
jgi:hypothetical protein